MGSYIAGTTATLPPNQPLGGVVGGGATCTPGHTIVDPNLGAPPDSTVAGQNGVAQTVNGGGTQPMQDLQSALTQLQAALDQLTAVLNAMQGAQSVQGGGAPTADDGLCGCACTCHSQTPIQSPVQTPSDSPTQGVPPAPDAAPVGDVRKKIVDIARQELAKNVREDAGSDTDKAGNIVKYRKAVTGPGENPNAAEPWCADFASWVSREAGVPIGKDGQGDDYTVTLVEWAKKEGRWSARKEAQPKPGDLIMLDWDKNGQPNHVAIVEKVENGRVHTIGGNESDRIKTASYALDNGVILGYIAPKGG